jgi:hypothetical protein
MIAIKDSLLLQYINIIRESFSMAFSLSTALTIIGSFGAASSAQIVSHILTQKREDKKYKKECLQNLYSPTILTVIDYIKLEGHNKSPLSFYNKSATNTKLLFEQIMDNIGSNIKYAEADLINIYQEVRNIENVLEPDSSLDDEVEEDISDHVMNLRMTLANLFFSQYIKVNNILKSNSNSITEKIIAPYFFSHFYLLVKECFYLNDNLSSEILALYDLVETILLPENNFLEKIIYIREELNIIMY